LSVVAKAFALVVFCVQMRACFLFPGTPTTVVSAKSKPLTVGLRSGILRLRALMDGILFYGKVDVLNVRETTFATLFYPLNHLLGFNLL
jgi:hypothetical protein